MAAVVGVGTTVGVSAGAEVCVHVRKGLLVGVETSAGVGSWVVTGVVAQSTVAVADGASVIAVDVATAGSGVADSWQLMTSAAIAHAIIGNRCFICR